MINLNSKIEAREDKGFDLTPAPEGDYVLRVKKIEDWVASKPQTIAVIQRDEKGKALKDEKGKNVTKSEENVIVYNAKVQLEIVGGESDGKTVFHNLTTHPNAPFNISAFLYGLGIKDIVASQIQEKCLGLFCAARVVIEYYDKTVEDKDTGMTEKVKTPINRINHFKQLPENFAMTQDENNEIEGI